MGCSCVCQLLGERRKHGASIFSFEGKFVHTESLLIVRDDRREGGGERERETEREREGEMILTSFLGCG